MRNVCRLVCLLALLAVSYGAHADAPPTKVEQRVLAHAQPASASLMKTLKGELQDAMKRGGPLKALSVCSEKASPLTESVNQSLEPGMEIKRTSLRYRNPQNAPDPGEERALNAFHTQIAERGTPVSYLIEHEKGKQVFRYYQPLFVGSACLACHGARKSFSKELRKILAERYPEDKAHGFQVGDLRGLIRVSVSEAVIDEE